MIMSDNSIVNLDNLALTVMETAIKKLEDRAPWGPKEKKYLLAVKSIALQIKSNQALTPVQQEQVLNLIYSIRTHKSTMGSMRKILSEIGSEREYVQHEIVKNDKL